MTRASLFKQPQFTRYLFSQTGSFFAYQMLSVAVGWQIYDITNSALSLGLVGLAGFLPQFLLSLPAGHVADRYDRRRVVYLAQACQGAMAIVLAAGSFAHWLDSTAIYVCAFVIGGARAFYQPAQQAMLPALVEREDLTSAISIANAFRNSSAIGGPALGGGLYILGADAVYALAAVIFLTAAILTSGIKLTTQPKSREPATLKSLFAGFVYIRGQPAILGALSLDLFAVLLGSVTALLPIYARDILHTGPWGLGVLRAAPAIGAVLMAIVMVRYPLDRRVGHVMFASVAVFGAANIVFGISDLFALSCVALIVAGGADMVSVVIRSTLVQLDTPDDMRGRVAAVNSVFIGTSNQLGQFWAGVVAAMIGAVPAVIIGGIGTLVVVAVSMRLFPGLVTRDTLATPETKS